MYLAFFSQYLAHWEELFLSLEEMILEYQPSLLDPLSVQDLFTYSSKRIPEETKISSLASNNPQSLGLHSKAPPHPSQQGFSFFFV